MFIEGIMIESYKPVPGELDMSLRNGLYVRGLCDNGIKAL
jgi:hypothetical protein